MHNKSEPDGNMEEYSIVLGGPLYQLYLGAKLAKKPLARCKRRIAAVTALAWLPLLLLTTLAGTVTGRVDVPFMFDIDVHVRLLISLALIIFAEVIAHQQISLIIRYFLKSGIIFPHDRPRFFDIANSLKRAGNAVSVEILLVLLVMTAGHWISLSYMHPGISSWYRSMANGSTTRSAAGYWYAFVSLPLFQFLLLRWYYRLGLWYRFLWQVSRFRLNLNSLHPDRAGGLGFLALSIHAFLPLLLAHSALLAGMIFGRIWNAGASLASFRPEMISMLFLLVLLPLIPMLFFTFSLVRAKRSGTLEYGMLANRYVGEFREKWLTAAEKPPVLLGTADIQSLSDLSGSFNVSGQMRLMPFSKNDILLLLVCSALPFVPLILTIIPLEKIFSQLAGLIF